MVFIIVPNDTGFDSNSRIVGNQEVTESLARPARSPWRPYGTGRSPELTKTRPYFTVTAFMGCRVPHSSRRSLARRVESIIVNAKRDERAVRAKESNAMNDKAAIVSTFQPQL